MSSRAWLVLLALALVLLAAVGWAVEGCRWILRAPARCAVRAARRPTLEA